MSNQKYVRVNISLPKDLFNQFSQYCRNEGMKPSSRIAVLIEKDLGIYKKEEKQK